ASGDLSCSGIAWDYTPGLVITQDVSFEGFTATDWQRLADVFRAPRAASDDVPDVRPGARGGVVAVTTGNRLRKLVHTKRGRLDLARAGWPMKLPELAGRYESSWAVELSTGALEELVERFSERLRPRQEYLEQALELLRALRELEAEGLIAMWPKRFSDIPVPGSRVISAALDTLCGEGKAIALGVFRHGELYTGIVLRRRGLGFDRIVGPDEIRPQMGLLSGDFRRDYRHFAAAAERNVGPLSLGIFGELLTFQSLADDAAPGAFALAVASRELLISPASPGLAVPLGVDVGRAAFAGLRGLAERLGAGGALSPLLGRAEAFVSRDLSALLGFDPWSVLVGLFERDREKREHD
ncbi:MAG: hypothetical protein ABI488_02685, partial [Polyangiaceae bacterium]